MTLNLTLWPWCSPLNSTFWKCTCTWNMKVFKNHRPNGKDSQVDAMRHDQTHITLHSQTVTILMTMKLYRPECYYSSSGGSCWPLARWYARALAGASCASVLCVSWSVGSSPGWETWHRTCRQWSRRLQQEEPPGPAALYLSASISSWSQRAALRSPGQCYLLR